MFSHLGYFEEFIAKREGCTPKTLGVRQFDLTLPESQQGRLLGVRGWREFDVTETITLQKGHRQVTYKASIKKPIRVATMLQKLEGR